MTIEISYSRLQSYMTCPWMYHLSYDLGWRTSHNPSTALGVSLHRALEAYMNPANKDKTLDRLFEFYDEHWVNEGFSTPQETFDTYDKGRRFLEQFFYEDKKRTSTVWAVEKDFEWNFDNIHFRGTIDRIDEKEDGSIELVEYKTNADHWSQERADTDLQMTLYSIGVEQGLNKKPSHLTFKLLSTTTQLQTKRTDEQKKEALSKMKKIATQIQNQEFTPNTNHCPTCDYRSRCTNAKEEK